MTQKLLASINLAVQILLFLSVLVAAYLARFKSDYKLHCTFLRVLVPVQIVITAAIMLPAMLSYISTRSISFNIVIYIHHSLGLGIIIIWIYVNLVLLSLIKSIGRLAIAMRIAFTFWTIVLPIGIYMYLVNWVL
jgi:hypothetical protein